MTHTYFMSHVMLRHILFVMARELLTERMWLVTSEHALTLSNCAYETQCSWTQAYGRVLISKGAIWYYRVSVSQNSIMWSCQTYLITLKDWNPLNECMLICVYVLPKMIRADGHPGAQSIEEFQYYRVRIPFISRNHPINSWEKTILKVDYVCIFLWVYFYRQIHT